MRKILISRTDWAQDPNISLLGGVWETDLPLVNILDPRPQFITQAVTNIDWSATKFLIDLNYQRKVGLFFFANLKSSSLGLMRLRAATENTFSDGLFDTGFISCRPQDSLSFGYTPWGAYTVSGVYDENEYIRLGMPRIIITPKDYVCRFILVEFMDSTSVDKLQLGCFGACEVWEPPETFIPGWSISGMDESDIQKVPYGTNYITDRGIRRRLSLGFPPLTELELLSKAFGLDLLKGRSKPLVVVPFPEDTKNLEKTSIYGLVSQDSVISNPFFGYYTYPLQIDQLR